MPCLPARPADSCRARRLRRAAAAFPLDPSAADARRRPARRAADSTDPFGSPVRSADASVGLCPIVDEHMVNGGAIARPDLDRLHPFRFGEVRRNVEPFVLDGAFRRNADSPRAFRARRPACRATSPRLNAGCAGKSFGSPFGAPPAAHAVSVSRSRSLSDRSL